MEQDTAQPRSTSSSFSSSSSSSSATVPTTTSVTNSTSHDEPLAFHAESSHGLIISPRQQENPVIRYIRNVPYLVARIIPDFLVGKYDAVTFISLKYHRLHQQYLPLRLGELKRNYNLRVLLCMVDLTDYENPLLEVNKLGLQHNMTLILAWSAEEGARIIETLKSFEDKGPELISGRLSEGVGRDRVVEVLTSIPSINKRDASVLIARFGSMKNIVLASEDDLFQCAGLGSKKVRSILSVLNEPFFDVTKLPQH